MTPAVSLAGVAKRFDRIQALSGVTLDVQPGEMYGLIGPDGAGKTTAIRILCGLLPPDAGEVRVFGRDPVRDRRALAEGVGYLSQRFSLYGDLTVDENLAFVAELHGMSRYSRRRDQLLEMTQLTPFRRRLAGRLSGGMKQKLALACTLVHEPRLVLLDEPTTGVDPVSRRELWKLLSEFLAGGVTILMSTPYLDEAERCARVGLLHEGRLLASDDPARLRSLAPGRVVELISAGAPAAVEVVRALPGVEDAQAFGERLHVTLETAGGEAVGRFAAALAATPLAGAPVRPVPPALEDVFISLIGKESVRA
jgi:ABC-2 type transport system ATP-binding protein